MPSGKKKAVNSTS